MSLLLLFGGSEDAPTPTLQVTIQMVLQGVWIEVGNDVIDRDAVQWSRGIFEHGPTARIARPGNLSFTLDNTEQNSAGLRGYYSPGHVNCRPGFKHGVDVRVRVAYGAVARYVWRGVVKTIAPEAGANGPKATTITAHDWMGRWSESDASNCVLRELVTADELIEDDLIPFAPAAPALLDLDVGQDVYPFVFDDLGGASPKCTQLALDLALSEGGYLYVRGDETFGETLRFENRFSRALSTSVATFTREELADDQDALQVPSTLDHILNDVEVETVTRRTDEDATSVLIQLDAPVRILSGDTVRLFVDYRDPAQEAAYVGGKDIVQPVANTDWTANEEEDGEGTDLTAGYTVTCEPFGSRAMLELTASSTGYVRGVAAPGMRVRGRGLYRYAPISSRGENATSITAFGQRQLNSPIVMPYQDDRFVGQDFAQFIANLWGSITNVPSRVQPLVDFEGSLLEQHIVRDIGDRITITEEQSAVDVDVFIHGIEQEYSNGLLKTWWTVEPADTTNLMVFDIGMFDVSAFGYG